MFDPTNQRVTLDLTKLNFSSLPDGVPPELLDKPSATELLIRLHEQFCTSVNGSPYTLSLEAAREIEEETELLLRFMFDYPGVDQLDDMIIDISSIHTSNSNCAHLLLDITDHFYGVIPPLPESHRLGTDIYPIYERVSAPMRIRLSITRDPDNSKRVEFTSIFSPEAYEELVHNLSIAARFVASPLKDEACTRCDIPVASNLLDLMLAHLTEQLASRSQNEAPLRVSWVSDIESINLHNNHEFEMTVKITEMRDTLSDQTLCHSFRRERIYFQSELDQFGRISLSLTGREIL